ncbi:MAG: hypothetical protein IPP14_14570 [Planctomycetes bacterium]|nr:hypothetical protein [Planctomycetota bacterium]
MKLLPILKLVRLSALPSALADVCGGVALAVSLGLGGRAPDKLGWLLLATVGIYLGGMALNDVLHASKDKLLGKPRPIARGDLTLRVAVAITLALYAAGLVGAWLAGCLVAATALAALTFLYNWLARGRHDGTKVVLPWPMAGAGVAVIAACRGLHVLLPVIALKPPGRGLGDTIAPLFAGCVFAYFALVTVVSLFEDSGGGRRALRLVSLLLLPVVLALPLWVMLRPGAPESTVLGTLSPLLIGAGLLLLLWRALDAARANPIPPKLGAVVGTGIRGECLLMASFALALAPHQPWWGLCAMACYPLARLLARWISPT